MDDENNKELLEIFEGIVYCGGTSSDEVYRKVREEILKRMNAPGTASKDGGAGQ